MKEMIAIISLFFFSKNSNFRNDQGFILIPVSYYYVSLDNRKDEQLHQLTKLCHQTQLCEVQERIKSLEIAMKKAKEIRRVPVLEEYCSLDTVLMVLTLSLYIQIGHFSEWYTVHFSCNFIFEIYFIFFNISLQVLETLQAPVDKKSFNVKCNTVGFGLRFVSCVFVCTALCSVSWSLCTGPDSSVIAKLYLLSGESPESYLEFGCEGLLMMLFSAVCSSQKL